MHVHVLLLLLLLAAAATSVACSCNSGCAGGSDLPVGTHVWFDCLTQQSDVSAAPPLRRYTQYLLDALRKRELFAWLDLAPQRWWHVLLFRDPYNWGGIDVPEVRARMRARRRLAALPLRYTT